MPDRSKDEAGAATEAWQPLTQLVPPDNDDLTEELEPESR